MATVIEIPPDIERRLEVVEGFTNIPREELAQDMIEEGLDELEIWFRAVAARDALRRGEEAEFSAQRLREEFDLEV